MTAQDRLSDFRTGGEEEGGVGMAVYWLGMVWTSRNEVTGRFIGTMLGGKNRASYLSKSDILKGLRKPNETRGISEERDWGLQLGRDFA